jgi:hypothetical protein
VLVEANGADMNKVLTSNIGEYLNKYGFEIVIDRKVEQDIDNALTSTDNWADDAGSRLIIIMPKASKLVLLTGDEQQPGTSCVEKSAMGRFRPVGATPAMLV